MSDELNDDLAALSGIPPVDPVEDDPLIRELRKTQDAIRTESAERQKAITGEQDARKRTSRRGVWIVLAALLWATTGVWFGATAYRTANRVEEVSSNSQDLALGGLVAVCAIGNVMRIDVQNMLTDLESSGVLIDSPPERRNAELFLIASRARFQPVDCKALVPEEDRLNITLNYPPVNKPGSSITTDVPRDTTTTGP